MGGAIQVQLGALADEVQAAKISSDSKHTALWCIEQLPILYAKFGQTNESRYGDEITRLVKGVLKPLVQSKSTSSDGQTLAVNISNRLRLLHEQLGLPELNLHSPRVAAARSRKVG